MTVASGRVTLKAIDDAWREDIDVNFDLIPHYLTGGIYASARARDSVATLSLLPSISFLRLIGVL